MLLYLFPAGTLITVPNGFKPIEQITPKDSVIAYDEIEKKFTTKKVNQTFKKVATQLVMLYALGGKLIAAPTPEHPFFVKNTYKPAKELVKGDTLLSKTNHFIVLDKVATVDSVLDVYNFEVDEAHNYLVGEDAVLVHNKCFGEIVKDLIRPDLFNQWTSTLGRRLRANPPYNAWQDYQRRVCGGTLNEYQIPFNGGSILADGIDFAEQALIEAKHISSLANTPFHIRSLSMLDKPWIKNAVDSLDDEFSRYARAIASGSTPVRQLIVRTNVSDPGVEAFFAHFFEKYNIPGRVDIVP
jgi:intein/homing endonuclease